MKNRIIERMKRRIVSLYANSFLEKFVVNSAPTVIVARKNRVTILE